MQVYRARMTGQPSFPLAYYLDNNAPILQPGQATQAQQTIDADRTKLQGFTFFECARFEQGFPVLAAFLLSGVDPNVTLKNDGVGAGALHIAARAGNLLAINFLLDNQADVNLRTRGGQTALMWAMHANQTGAASLLLRRGADAHMVDDEGNGLMTFAIDSPFTLHFLAQHMDVAAAATKDFLLHKLAKSPGSRFSCLYCIEQLGLNINEKDLSSKTPLHHAALTGDIDLVKTLCSKGADLMAVDERGQRAETQVGVTEQIRKFIKSYSAESSNTNRERLATPDFSNLARLDLKQAKHFTVAFTVPNILIFIGSFLPVYVGFLGLVASAIGFTMVAKFGMGQRGRSMATAGWFLGALAFGGGVVVQTTLPSYALERPDSWVPQAWWVVTILMFYCYVRAVLADPGAVQSTAEGRRQIFEIASVGGQQELQNEGIDTTSMVKKPLRSKHCSKTGQCVYRFDHYCVWTGNAIGGGNHRFFVLYCLFQFCSQTLVAYTTAVYLLKDGPKRLDIDSYFSPEYRAFTVNPQNILVTYLLVFYNSFVFLFVSSVLFGQIWYATRNVTSNEVWFAERYKWMFLLGKRAISLYDNGWKANLLEFFWSGNLCAELHTLPPMNEYLKKRCQQFAAQERNRQQHAQNMQSRGGARGGDVMGDAEAGYGADDAHQHTGGAPGPFGGFDYASAVAQLPDNIQQEMKWVQAVLQQMVSRGSPDNADVPADVPADRRDHILHQARTMYDHFQATLQINRQNTASSQQTQQAVIAESSERTGLLSDAEASPRSSVVEAAPGPKQRGGRKAD